ncbi:hypothetical protein JZ751_029842 [Albula glossodonta]|uniref:PH domain-containing protein n=1 Tax=Albula glossodonta TaxID=121402 RepID=A0A8T2NAV6_9TELE|nr:hypothetical protein JZ751_029842 [Albula glossodonta]
MSSDPTGNNPDEDVDLQRVIEQSLLELDKHEVQCRLTSSQWVFAKADSRGWIPLHEAAAQSNINILTMTYAVNQKGAHFRTALHDAARLGMERFVDLLLKAGADPDPRSAYGLTPLALAAQCGHQDIVEILLQKGADVESQALDSATILFEAAASGNPEIISLLLEYGADPNIPKHTGHLPIHRVAHRGHLRALEILIPVTTWEAVEDSGMSPLHSAAAGGHPECLELLLSAGYDANYMLEPWVRRNYHDQRKSALYFAVSNGDVRSSQILLEAGAMPNQDPVKCLQVALRLGNHQLIHTLLRYGANVNYYSRVNTTHFPSALQYAMKDEVTLRMLLNYGYDVRRCFDCPHGDGSHVPHDYEGWTPSVIKDTMNVRCLKHLCRLKIRDCMGRLRLRAPVFMSFLPLPDRLKDYILDMPGIDKLPIEETLEDSPQTRSLLGVFEEDAAAISSYSHQLFQAMQRIYDAQNELSAATHLTSKLLKEYEKQRFPLGGDDEVMSSTLQQFAKVIDELSSCHAVLSTQLADAMMFPITQFKERDLKDHDMAINRYSRLSKRRDNEKVRSEVMEDVYTSRKKQHQTMMHYFTALNTLQYKKKIALLEPLLGYMQAQIPINRNLTRKAGYLNTRNKTGLVSSSWDRQYFFTQGGNLMSQARGDVAGGLVMDIDNCSVMAVDCEDRRFCFQITSFDGKKVAILQAESRKDCEEWISTINNISKRIYLSENPESTNQLWRPQGRPRAGRTSSQSSVGSESPALSSLTLDALVAPDTPIQFDIISPVSEETASQAKSAGQGGRSEHPSPSQNPDKPHRCQTIKINLILAARAIHNIFRMTESHLLVTCDCLKLIDPQTQVTRLRFPLSSVVLCGSHQENKRLFGFVLQTGGGRADGQPVSICDSVGLAKQIAFHSEMDRRATEKQKELEKAKEKQQEELSKQRQIEKDLEEQSRLIAASSRPNPAAADGQFLVLSNSQSEDSDAGEDGRKKGESEA